MPRYPFFQVDAFTTRALAGNPCAVVLDADDLEATTMQAVAKEMNLPETAFVGRSSIADWKARYFTPATEIPLAGHPTISVGWVLQETGRLDRAAGSFSLELRDGPIQVDLETDGNTCTAIVMTQRRPEFGTVWEPEQVLPAFGLGREDLLADVPIQTVSTGTRQLMVPLCGLDSLRRARIDPVPYARLREAADFFSPHLFCLGGFTAAGTTAARHLDVAPDIAEDPFTGSATGGMAAYLWRYGLIAEPRLVAEQGHDLGRPGTAGVEVVGPRDAIETVKVGGPAITVIRGEIEI